MTKGTLGELLGKFDYYVTHTTLKVECLPVRNCGWGEEFEKEKRQGKNQHEDSAHINAIDRIYKKVKANTIIDLYEGDLALKVLYYQQPGDSK